MQVPNTIPEVRKALKEAEERLADVLKRKNKAISKVDLMFGYDWKFYTEGNCPLLVNHVTYYTRKLNELQVKG